MDGLGRRKEPIQMTTEEREHAVVQPDAFPDAVAHKERRVEDRNRRLRPRDEFAVDVDQYFFVALVWDGDMSALHSVDAISGCRRCFSAGRAVDLADLFGAKIPPNSLDFV